MSTGTMVSEVIHLFVAALWTGSVMFFALGVLPVARTNLTDRILDRFVMLSRGSSVVMLLTGGHLAATQYGDGALTGTARGHAVLGMLALWVVLMGLLEAGNARVEGDTVGPTATRLFQAGALVAALLLVDAGLLLSGAV
ncbi:MAG: transporter [Halobacteriaceae archaeon]